MSKIFITRPLLGNTAELLRQKGYDVVMQKDDKPLSKERLLKELRGEAYDGVLCFLNDTIDADVFDAAPSVKIFANYAVGFNNIDVHEAARRGVAVTNTPSDRVNDSVAEHTFSLLLSLARRIVEADAFVRGGKYKGWNPNLFLGMDIKGKTLGVLGAGRIGTSVVQKAVQGFGMNAVYFDIVKNKPIEKDYGAQFFPSVDEVLARADVVTLHVNLTPETKHLVNAERLARMKKEALLINTCRGPVVDEQALAHALATGVIRGAALDVYEFEPNVVKELFALPNIVLTPHIASATEASRSDMSRIAAENLIDFFEGRKPRNKVS